MFLLEFFLCSSLLLTATGQDYCRDNIPNTRLLPDPLQFENKCIYLSGSKLLWTQANSLFCSKGSTPLSIDSSDENQAVREYMDAYGSSAAYIGYTFDGTKWSWSNNDPSSYENLAGDYATFPTETPQRTTLDPGHQRKPVSIVIAIDAGVYSSGSLVAQEIDFARRLGDYISARGPASFAFFLYGCNSQGEANDYPNYVYTYEDMLSMTHNLSDYYDDSCLKSNPLLLPTVAGQCANFYYNDRSIRPVDTSSFLAFIFLSTTKSTDDVSKANPFYAIDGWPVIAISVGSGAANISKLAIPSSKNFMAINDFTNMNGIIAAVDSMIFPPGISQFAVLEAATPSLYAFLNATDGFWYESNGLGLMQMLCQLEIPKPPTTTIDPNQEWANPCQGPGNFSHFKELNNSKCYKVSDDMKTFAESMSYCLELAPKMVYKHPPVLTSIETEAEMTQLRYLVGNHTEEAMFWIGLYYSRKEEIWRWVNGMPYDSTTYSPWREGYPRIADGCYCAAYSYTDDKWVNTYCNDRLYSLCAYRFNTTM